MSTIPPFLPKHRVSNIGGYYKIWVGPKVNKFWLFKLDCDSRYGSDRGLEVAHASWTTTSESLKDWYTERACALRRTRGGCYTTQRYRAPAGHGPVEPAEPPCSRAWAIVRSERAGGIGLDMTELDHWLDVTTHAEDRM